MGEEKKEGMGGIKTLTNEGIIFLGERMSCDLKREYALCILILSFAVFPVSFSINAPLFLIPC